MKGSCGVTITTEMLWVFMVGVAVFAVYAAVQFYRYRGSAHWPVVEGIIEGSPEFRVTGGAVKCYVAILFYSYAPDGDCYSGEWTSPPKSDKQALRDIVAAKLPGGTKIRILYNPKRPSMSIAEIPGALFDDDAMIRLEL